MERKQAGKPTIECGEKPYADVSVTELLEGIHYSTLDQLDVKGRIHILEIVGRGQRGAAPAGAETALHGAIDCTSGHAHVESAHQEPVQRSSQCVCHHAGRPSFLRPTRAVQRGLRYSTCSVNIRASPHMVAGEKGYPAPKDREWWRQVRPWLRQLSKILKFVPKLSAVGKLYDERGRRSSS